jgi:hypothetical protein
MAWDFPLTLLTDWDADWNVQELHGWKEWRDDSYVQMQVRQNRHTDRCRNLLLQGLQAQAYVSIGLALRF